MICFKLPNGIIINKFAYKFISCSNIDFQSDSNIINFKPESCYYFTVKLYSIYEKKVEEMLFKHISSIEIENMYKEIKRIFEIKY